MIADSVFYCGLARSHMRRAAWWFCSSLNAMRRARRTDPGYDDYWRRATKEGMKWAHHQKCRALYCSWHAVAAEYREVEQ